MKSLNYTLYTLKKVKLDIIDPFTLQVVFSTTKDSERDCLKYYNDYLKTMGFSGKGYKKEFWYKLKLNKKQ